MSTTVDAAARFQRIQALFTAASSLPRHQRTAYLEGECGHEPEILAEVLSLLAAASEAGDFLEDVPTAVAEASAAASDDRHTTIGPYRVLEVLGSGGMGVVYLAEQTEPVRRRVALKVIKAGMDTASVIARFSAERQALALMDHPGIARVLDAGATDGGRPYFVMEVVNGLPITACARQRGLDLEQRLRLFTRVCDALQHAHQKGIIHRDIKPTNVLVEDHDGELVPKIIDFGVAKATTERLTDRTLHTVQGQMIGTLEYMSPEQAEMAMADVDTRADIYSLGVLLFELLTGELPFASDRLRTASFTEIQRIVTREEPPRPSDVLAGRTEPGAGAMALPELIRELRRDLDWVILKAMAKDRDERYASASELALEIRRYLADLPLMASAPSTVHRLRKFVRRHQRGVAAGVSALALLLVGVAATTSQAIRATRAEREARRQAAVAAEVNRFLVAMLAEADPQQNPTGQAMTVAEALEAAARLVEVESLEPEIEAEVRFVIGEAFFSLARHEDAAAQLRAALAAVEGLPGVSALDRARIEMRLAAVLVDLGQTDEAEGLAGQALAVFERSDGEGSLDLVGALRQAGDLLKTRGDPDGARSHYERALTVARGLADDQGQLAVARTLMALAVLDSEALDLASAEARIREGLEIQRRTHGDIHPLVAESVARLAVVESEKGNFDEADRLFRQSLDSLRRVYGDGHLRVGITLHSFGLHLRRWRPASAEPYLREAVEIFRALGNPAAEAVGLDSLGALLMDLERLDQAETAFARALELRRSSLPPDHPEIATGLNNLGTLLNRSGRPAEAVPVFREVVERFTTTYGDGHPRVAIATYNLGTTLCEAGQAAEGLRFLEDALDLAEAMFPPGHVNLTVMRSRHGRCLDRLGRHDEAERILLEAHAALAGQLGEDHWRAREVAGFVADLFAARGRAAEASRWRERSQAEAGTDGP